MERNYVTFLTPVVFKLGKNKQKCQEKRNLDNMYNFSLLKWTSLWTDNQVNGKRSMSYHQTPQVFWLNWRRENVMRPIWPFASVQRWVKRRDHSGLCLRILASDSMTPYKLKCHLETLHPEHREKPMNFFRRKWINYCAQQCHFTKAASVPSNAQLASCKVAHRVALC